MAESETPVQAIYAAGRWIGVCPTDMNAMLLEYSQTRFECGSQYGFGADGTTADIEWPADVGAIEESLDGFAIDDQNWSPS
jgi:hypothetical protein